MVDKKLDVHGSNNAGGVGVKPYCLMAPASYQAYVNLPVPITQVLSLLEDLSRANQENNIWSLGSKTPEASAS